MWQYILLGAGFGFTAAAVPGPLQAFIISQSLTRGWKQALPAAFAPLISDGPIIVLCLVILNEIPIWFQDLLYIAGGVFILYLAWGAYRSWKNFDVSVPSFDAEPNRNIGRAVLMNFLSPGPYLFWSLVTGPILLRGWNESPVHGIGFLVSFYAVLVTGLAGIILLFGMARELGPKVNKMLAGASVIALVSFGVYQFWMGLVA